MRRIAAIVLAALILAPLGIAYAHDQPEAKAPAAKKAEKSPRLEGTVRNINKETSTITVSRGSVRREIVYTPETQFTKLNKPGGSLDEIKEGTRIIALGKWDGAKLVADRIDIRLPK